MRIAFRGAPGTGAAQTAVGTWLTRKTVSPKAQCRSRSLEVIVACPPNGLRSVRPLLDLLDLDSNCDRGIGHRMCVMRVQLPLWKEIPHTRGHSAQFG